MNIPYKYQNVKVQDIPEDVMKAYKQITCGQDTKTCIYLYGNVGSGKTHIAWALLKEANDQEKEARVLNKQQYIDKKQIVADCHFLTLPLLCEDVRNMPALLSAIKAEFDKERFAQINILGELLTNDTVLILDDVGSEKPSVWTQEKYFEIIDDCYTSGRPLIITSNLTLNKLDAIIGQRSADRLREICIAFDMSTNKSKRVIN